MRLSWLDECDTWVIVAMLLCVMIVTGEIAYFAGYRWSSRAVEAGKGHFSAVQGSLLGLIALLLSFTFNMSAQRYETRRQLTLEEANTLNAVYLRSDMLPAPQRAEFKGILRQYVDGRVDPLQNHPTTVEMEQAVAQSEKLYAQMWTMAKSMAQQNNPPKGADNLVNILIEASSSNSRRISAFISRVPDTILWMLLASALVGVGVISYSAGLGKHRAIAARIFLSFLICGTIYVLLDLDHPGRGLVKIDQSPMIHLKALIDSDPEAM